MNIIIPTIGKERQKTYSPFLPICPDSGKVLEIPILEIDEKNSWYVRSSTDKKRIVNLPSYEFNTSAIRILLAASG